ncbi:glycosyltransferase family 39 protein [Ancylobacter sp. FA202]|uniref:ArnT family glycosyltransferase n=1 Tax=Ancylobacter sp. FA202 TaxID=1111106 RepID=UPI0003662299|nr:glycosyltransferase family 39 protein [Ancylobacter sp. FA202]
MTALSEAEAAIATTPSLSRAGAGPLVLALALSFATLALTLLLRGPFPVDETRYLTVAWEMWTSGDTILLHLNGAPYSHKPPLLFWLVNLAWSVTGPQEWSARLIPALFFPLSVLATYRLGRDLAGPALGGRAAVVLAGFTAYAALATSVMFDAMLTTASVTALIGLLRAGRGQAGGWAIFCLSVAFGLLAKGPVMLVQVLPAALLAPLWAERPAHWRRWYLALAGALALATLPVFVWAVAAAGAAGEAFAGMLLWRQTAGRMVEAFAHRRPFWFYLPLLPALLFPWWCLSGFWNGAAVAALWRERAWRLPVITAAGTLIIMSAISSKQLHYLLPALPAAALLLARLIGAAPSRAEMGPALAVLIAGIAMVGSARLAPNFPEFLPPLAVWPGLLLIALGVPVWALRRHALSAGAAVTGALLLAGLLQAGLGRLPAFDLAPLLVRIDATRPIAVVGLYEGEIGYLARLTRPMDLLRDDELKAWRTAHPDGQILARFHAGEAPLASSPAWEQPFMKQRLGLWPASPAH